ncbi:Thioredoxin reductase [Variovorax sp. PBS-H4]|uniref:NAD(P)/FAD-dependent oxidoreductase n=1 Tax=Variovorax sp. PBS-H4 TaxID=434008 RepID=UPI0013161401|nr:NAD(P)/FAD-dependent oxidoreductase [Variovorax sp. PBS-H4]VTU26559.1 Thioredoxin reductase [Variovorax sp. PBS-H4]
MATRTSLPAVDAAIIGGGPAGLVAAVYLARLRRSVAIVDASQSRLATIPRARNYPGFPDGIPGAALLGALREQADRYPIERGAGHVDALERIENGFRLAWEGGDLTARLVLLASGTSDVVPAMPHLSHSLRKGLLRYCPVCDGYEVIDRKVGVLANGPTGVQEALYLRHFTPDLTLFMTPDAQALAPAERERLARAGIRLAVGAVESIRDWNGRISVRHGGADTACESLYSALGLEVHSTLAKQVGARTDESGYVLTDRHQETDVPGLYAAGDVVLGLNQIAVAAGTAAIAGAAMHLALHRREPR